MNGDNLLIDTNIALYLLSGDKVLAGILDNCDVYVSFITELELLGYHDITQQEQIKVKDFLNDCIIIDLNESIKILTIELKQNLRIKLPDAIIAATAKYLNMPLVSADSDFSNVDQIQFIKYQL